VLQILGSQGSGKKERGYASKSEGRGEKPLAKAEKESRKASWEKRKRLEGKGSQGNQEEGWEPTNSMTVSGCEG